MKEISSDKWTIVSLIATLTWASASAGDRDAKAEIKNCSVADQLDLEELPSSTFKWTARDRLPEHHCLWTVLSTKGCPIGIKCELELTSADDCSDTGAYVKVSDGSGGEKIYCGQTSFTARPSDPNLRDIFLKLYIPQGYTGKGLKCKAKCDTQNEMDPLPKNIERKRDMRCVCGLQNKDDRIVGGEDSKMNEFPWQAAVVQVNTRSPLCGASVINDRFVLCAAHCFWFSKKKPEKIEVLIHAHTLDMTKKSSHKKSAKFGEDGSIQSSGWNLTKKTDEDEKTQRFKVLEIINHPEFSPVYDYDIALLKLDRKINLGDPDAPTPVCLPPANLYDKFTDTLLGKELTVVGWGLAAENAGGTTRVLQKLDVPFLPDDQCKATNPDLVTPRMLCAGHTDGRQQDACTGDSGGPLIYKQENKQFVQAGIVSWGEGCARKGKAGVYARVSELMQWVDFHSQEHEAKWCQDEK